MSNLISRKALARMTKLFLAVALFLLAGYTPMLAQGTKKAESKKQAGGGKPMAVGAQEAYRISVRIRGLADTSCYLAYHMGDKQYLADTAKVDKEGRMVFTGTETLDPGIYMVVLPSRKYFEIIVAEQRFSLETDSGALNENLVVAGSKENQIFGDYIKYVNGKGAEINRLAKRLPSLKDKKDSTELVRSEVRKLEEEIAQRRRDLAAQNPGTFMSKILLALTDPQRPEPPKASNARPDSTYKFYDSRAHYFDNVDFGDERLLRTPILHSKVKYYLEQLTVPDPDSINKSADVVLGLTQKSKPVFRYFLWYISNTYETSKYMGMDAVFAHVARKYYLSGLADWVDSTTKRKIRERVDIVEPLLIGKQAPLLMLSDTNNQKIVVNRLPARYTVLAFYDPNCGHCQKDIPKLSDFYNTYKAKGIPLLAVAACGERNPKEWKAFVRKNKLATLNLFDKDTIVDFRKYWDVYSYPVLYVLDEKKKIIAKRIGVDDLAGFIDQLEKNRLIADKKSSLAKP